jgi:hypothetical protein
VKATIAALAKMLMLAIALPQLTEWVDSSEDFKEITWDNRPTLPRQTFHFNPVS